jgi:hypothetical protein
VGNLARALREGWDEVSGPLIVVEGPKGSAEVKFLSDGDAIQGADWSGSLRQLNVDNEIWERTGLVEPVPASDPAGTVGALPHGIPAPGLGVANATGHALAEAQPRAAK